MTDTSARNNRSSASKSVTVSVAGPARKGSSHSPQILAGTSLITITVPCTRKGIVAGPDVRRPPQSGQWPLFSDLPVIFAGLGMDEGLFVEHDLAPPWFLYTQAILARNCATSNL